MRGRSEELILRICAGNEEGVIVSELLRLRKHRVGGNGPFLRTATISPSQLSTKGS